MSGRFLLLLSLLILLAGCSATQPVAQSPRPEELDLPPLEFNIPEIEPVILANGIRLYLKEDNELPLVSLTVMVGGGDIQDPPEMTGQGGLFAVMLESGGAGERDPEQLEEYLDDLAANVSVGIGPYATTIGLNLLAEDLPAGLELLNDVLRQPRFDAGRLEVKRNQMLESIRRQDDEPGSIAGRALDRAVFGDHPFGRTPTEETVRNITRDALTGFHQRHFVPDNLWLAISGDFDRDVLLAEIDRVFGDWLAVGYTPEPVPELTGSLPPAVWVAEKDIPQTTVMMGGVGISKDDPDMLAVRVMNFILGGGGFNSRLLREIRSNRGLAYSVYSYYMVGRELPGSFIASGETKSASTMEMTRIMLAEMERIRTEPVSEQELELAKQSRINSFVFAFDNTHEVLTQQMRIDFHDYPDGYLQNYRDIVAALTRDDILRVAQQYLHPDKLAIVLVGRRAEFDEPPEALGRPVREIPLRNSSIVE